MSPQRRSTGRPWFRFSPVSLFLSVLPEPVGARREIHDRGRIAQVQVRTGGLVRARETVERPGVEVTELGKPAAYVRAVGVETAGLDKGVLTC